MVTDRQLHDQLAGVQVAVFEVVWPAVPALRSVHAITSDRAVELYCGAEPALSVRDRADCERLLKEVLESAFPGAATIVKFDSPPPSDAVEVMSPRIFESVARAVAPWRLKGGR